MKGTNAEQSVKRVSVLLEWTYTACYEGATHLPSDKVLPWIHELCTRRHLLIDKFCRSLTEAPKSLKPGTVVQYLNNLNLLVTWSMVWSDMGKENLEMQEADIAKMRIVVGACLKKYRRLMKNGAKSLEQNVESGHIPTGGMPQLRSACVNYLESTDWSSITFDKRQYQYFLQVHVPV